MAPAGACLLQALIPCTPRALHPITHAISATTPPHQTAYDKYRSLQLGEGSAAVRFTMADAQALSNSGGGGSGSGRTAQPQQPAFGPQVAEQEGFRAGQFDTVVDTFGLCSCDDPVGALQERDRGGVAQAAALRAWLAACRAPQLPLACAAEMLAPLLSRRWLKFSSPVGGCCCWSTGAAHGPGSTASWTAARSGTAR